MPDLLERSPLNDRLHLTEFGTGVVFTTLLSVLADRVPETVRGRAASRVSALAYLGFLLGPAYVGWWAGTTDLPGAMIAVAVLAAALCPHGAARTRCDGPGWGTPNQAPALVRHRYSLIRTTLRNVQELS